MIHILESESECEKKQSGSDRSRAHSRSVFWYPEPESNRQGKNPTGF